MVFFLVSTACFSTVAISALNMLGVDIGSDEATFIVRFLVISVIFFATHRALEFLIRKIHKIPKEPKVKEKITIWGVLRAAANAMCSSSFSPFRFYVVMFITLVGMVFLYTNTGGYDLFGEGFHLFFVSAGFALLVELSFCMTAGWRSWRIRDRILFYLVMFTLIFLTLNLIAGEEAPLTLLHFSVCITFAWLAWVSKRLLPVFLFSAFAILYNPAVKVNVAAWALFDFTSFFLIFIYSIVYFRRIGKQIKDGA